MIPREVIAAAEAIRAGAAEREPRVAELPITAIGWASVDADRALEELGGGAWQAVDREALLGARVWRRAPAADGGIELRVLEPDTEGRLAAFLARFGEGVAAVYLRAAGTEGERLSNAGRLVGGGPVWGPHTIVLGDPLPATAMDDVVE